ncbi:MAG: hypothetical protein GF355_13585 [Candidatus Eisenbacteria bacterium]|nr:hypothetical protein [Candidatus Eisenbacteria bacterium]
MRRRNLTLALALLMTLPLAAQAGDAWLHVYVDDHDEADRVRINLPLNLVEVILPMVETDELDGGRLYLEQSDLSGIDLQELAAALREAADGEYVTVEGAEENVTIRKEGDRILVHVDGEDEQVDINVPIQVMSALVTDDPHELNILAAVQALSEVGDTGIITVQEDETQVRIWVDERSSQDD